jgi:TPR repeat protein
LDVGGHNGERPNNALRWTDETVRQPANLIATLAILGTILAAPARAADAVIDQSTIAAFGDPTNALRRIGSMVRSGNARAEALLGYIYEYGIGVPQSWSAAVDYYLLSAEHGDPTGQYLLGLMYDKGFGVSRDVVLAYKWLDLAAARAPKGNRGYFLRLRNAIASKMTRAQLDLGQQLALEWSVLRTGRQP